MMRDEHDDMLIFGFWQLLFLRAYEHEERDEDARVYVSRTMFDLAWRGFDVVHVFLRLLNM